MTNSREQYGNQTVSEAFAKADNVLTSAAKGIAELITVTGYINIDFQDVKTVIENSGKAIMGSATAEGEGRALLAIEEAMSSPLLNDNDIKGAQNILLYIMTGAEKTSRWMKSLKLPTMCSRNVAAIMKPM